MKITDEVKYAVLSEYGMDAIKCAPKVAQAVIQAYLESIWKVFDADDESTWPDDDIDKTLLVKADGIWFASNFGTRKTGYPKHWVHDWINKASKVIYLDPADIMVTDERYVEEAAKNKHKSDTCRSNEHNSDVQGEKQ